MGGKLKYSFFEIHGVSIPPGDTLDYGKILLYLLFIFIAFLTNGIANSIQWTDPETKELGFVI